MNVKARIAISISIISMIIFGVVYYVFFAPKFLYSESSPDGNYTISFYAKPKFFSAPGDGSTYCAVVKLYDKNGRKLRESCEDCPVFTNDIELRWNIEKRYVAFTRGGQLELSKGGCTD